MSDADRKNGGSLSCSRLSGVGVFITVLLLVQVNRLISIYSMLWIERLRFRLLIVIDWIRQVQIHNQSFVLATKSSLYFHYRDKVLTCIAKLWSRWPERYILDLEGSIDGENSFPSSSIYLGLSFQKNSSYKLTLATQKLCSTFHCAVDIFGSGFRPILSQARRYLHKISAKKSQKTQIWFKSPTDYSRWMKSMANNQLW